MVYPLNLINATVVDQGNLVKEFHIAFNDSYCLDHTNHACEIDYTKNCRYEKNQYITKKRNSCIQNLKTSGYSVDNPCFVQ